MLTQDNADAEKPEAVKTTIAACMSNICSPFNSPGKVVTTTQRNLFPLYASYATHRQSVLTPASRHKSSIPSHKSAPLFRRSDARCRHPGRQAICPVAQQGTSASTAAHLTGRSLPLALLITVVACQTISTRCACAENCTHFSLESVCLCCTASSACDQVQSPSCRGFVATTGRLICRSVPVQCWFLCCTAVDCPCQKMCFALVGPSRRNLFTRLHQQPSGTPPEPEVHVNSRLISLPFTISTARHSCKMC